MTHVHAPYHFVPLSKWVYMPDWAHLVSHDVPFEQGYSGKIEYTLTNATPLLVGGEQQQTEGKPTLVKWAVDPQGNPVIPGSSLKGMARNVLEIATFAKFSAIDDDHFSYRDISNAVTEYQKKLMNSRCQAYWLKFDDIGKAWTLRKANHIELFHDELNRHTGCHIKNESFNQPAEKKYQQWPLTQPAIRFGIADREIEGTKGKNVRVARATTLGSGEHEGHPVFSGFRPGLKRYVGTRLNYSYMFYDTKPTTLVFDNGAALANKLFANHTDALVECLKKNAHPQYGIPVFAREDKATNKMLALGFAKMPRMLYEHSVQQVVHTTQKSANSDCYFDTAELLFGCLRENGFGLKSRVTFADAICTSNKGIFQSNPVILGQPKASYLPAYLEQFEAKDAVLQVTKHTDLSKYQRNSVLSGWKRYPAQNGFNDKMPQDLKDKDKDKVNVQSQLELMQPDSEFTGQIVFHNLKPQELGALLWTLQFGQAPQNRIHYHSLGHGKPLGAGAVQLTVSQLQVTANQWDESQTAQQSQSEDFVTTFVDHMNEVYPSNSTPWQDSPQIAHLLAFADKADNKDKAGNEGKGLTYMKLKPDHKGDKTMTYTSSVQGLEKHVLPAWQAKEGTLNRAEDISRSPNAIASFGQGRLADLVEQKQRVDGLTMVEAAELDKANEACEQQRLQESQQKQQAAFETLPPIAQAFVLIQNKLAPFANEQTQQAKEGRQSYNADIEKLLDECLATYVESAFVQAFYAICIDKNQSAYLDLAKSKKNKPKLQARKAKLSQFATKYNLL
jgi:CRISPR-associated protein (TIGR03986 family)